MDYRLQKQKLNQELLNSVKLLLDEGYSYNEIAKKINTTPQHINYLNKKLKAQGGEE